MIKRLVLVTSALASLATISASASAATILSFRPLSEGVSFSANQSGSTTTLSASDVGINLTAFGGAAQDAFFTLTAANSGEAIKFGSSILQNFAGTFAIYTSAGMTGTKILGGTFNTGLLVGNDQAGNLQSSSPSDAVTFTSDYANVPLSSPALSLSLVAVSPNVSLCNVGGVGGATICSFGSSVTGNFSASSAVPEPASWAMMVGGFGLLGATMRRRRVTTAVSFS